MDLSPNTQKPTTNAERREEYKDGLKVENRRRHHFMHSSFGIESKEELFGTETTDAR